MNWLKNRLAERSTWAAISCLLTIAGLGLSDESSRLFIEAGMAVGSFILFFMKEKASAGAGA